MALPDISGFLNVPGLKPPIGRHWTWWVLWALWVGLWLALAAIIIAVLLGF